MLKKSASMERDSPVSPLCSRNARSQKTLVGRAQLGDSSGPSWGNVNEQAWKSLSWVARCGLAGRPFWAACDYVALSAIGTMPLAFYV